MKFIPSASKKEELSGNKSFFWLRARSCEWAVGLVTYFA
jgi:hypothetical protein